MRFYRKLTRTAQGYHSIAIPAELVAHLGLEAGGYAALDTEDGKIIITRVEGAEHDRT